jgi:hypothetical protein
MIDLMSFGASPGWAAVREPLKPYAIANAARRLETGAIFEVGNEKGVYELQRCETATTMQREHESILKS